MCAVVNNEMQESLRRVLVDLNQATEEVSRPDEDVVTYAICLTSRQIIRKLLRIFLSSQSIPFNDAASILDLLNACKQVDAQFGRIEINEMSCSGLNVIASDNTYCLPVDNVMHCMLIANQIKELVLSKLGLTESELN